MDSRKWQAYASLAEVLSAVAIVVSLLYAVSEFRRAETLSSRDADLILFERTWEGNRMLIESPELADVVVAAETNPDSLSDTDRLRYLAYQHQFFDSWEIGWSYHADGILDEETWREWDEWFTSQVRDRPGFAWTASRRHFTGDAFRRHVDAIVARGDSPRSSETDEPLR